MKQPYPNADSLMAGSETSPEQADLGTDTERTVRVQRSAFAATLIAGTAPAAPTQSAERSAPAASARPRPPASPTAGATRPPAPPTREPTTAEPLRIPSNRPPPTPFEKARSARPDSTLLMPGSVPLEIAGTPRRAFDNKKTPVVQHPAIAINATLQGSPAPVARPRSSTPSAAPPVPPQRSTAATPSAKPPAAKPSVSGPPRSSGPAPASQAPAATAPKRADSAASAAPARASMPAAAGHAHGGSEPLRLQLSERDFLPELATSARPVVPRSRTPWILAGFATAIVIVVLGLWLGSRGARPAAPQASMDGVRNTAVPAAAPTAAPAPTAPAIAPTPTASAAAEPRAAQPPHVEPAAARAKSEPVAVAAPAAAPSHPSTATKPVEPQARRRADVTAAKPAAPSASAPPETRESIEGARAALKALESQPVISVKPTDDEPSAPSDDAPALKVSPKTSPPPPEGDSPEAPPPAPEGE